MNTKALLIIGLVLAGAGIAVGLLGRSLVGGDPARSRAADLLKPDPNWEDFRIPDFSLLDQDGEAVDASIFDHHVTIVDFIFTNCPLQCPAMTGAMWQMSEDLKDTGVRFLSMSIDPAHDTPERLHAYAADYKADPQRWRFVTGPDGAVRRIVQDALKFGVEDRPDMPPVTLADGSKMSNIVHPALFVLVGPDRQVLGIFRYQAQSEIDRLKDRARKIAATLR